MFLCYWNWLLVISIAPIPDFNKGQDQSSWFPSSLTFKNRIELFHKANPEKEIFQKSSGLLKDHKGHKKAIFSHFWTKKVHISFDLVWERGHQVTSFSLLQQKTFFKTNIVSLGQAPFFGNKNTIKLGLSSLRNKPTNSN